MISSVWSKTMQGSVTEETLAVESIEKVGIGNNFLALKQTRQLVDYPSNPMLLDRRMFGDWAAAGSKDLAAVAHEKVVDVLKNHEVKRSLCRHSQRHAGSRGQS